MRIWQVAIAFVSSLALQIVLASWTRAGAPTTHEAGAAMPAARGSVHRSNAGGSMERPMNGAVAEAWGTMSARDVGPTTSALVPRSGDVEVYLKSIQYGSADDGLWSRPSRSDRRTFAQALALVFAGDYEQAAQEAQRIGFQLVEFTDPSRGVLYILQDTPNASNIAPGGTYVWNPATRYTVVVEVPHPRFDSNTNNEGIELFLSTNAAMLSLSGTHRRSDRTSTTCDGASSNDYRRSDPAHAEAHFFDVAHRQAEADLSEPLYIQLHGFGSSAYDRLKRECKHRTRRHDPELLVNVSDTYKDRSGTGAPPAGSFARILHDTINAEGTIKSCLYNEDTHSYGGTLNVQGRHTNGSIDPCTEHAAASNGRFIHLEQSYNTRRYERPRLISLIREALRTYYGF